MTDFSKYTLTGKHYQRLRQYPIVPAVLLIVFIIISFIWNFLNERQQTVELARQEANINFSKDISLRLWATKHGGVYVPVSAETLPNPYLDFLLNRDITTPDEKKLTLMNPAYMIRQVMEQYKQTYGITGHITSLNPLNPDNKADEWEQKALHSFEKGVNEVFEVVEQNGEQYLRLIRPLVTKEGCLNCHKQQGYQVGDVRGAIGVTIPLSDYLEKENRAINRLILSHLFIGILGVSILVYLAFQTRKNIKIQKLAENEIHKINTDLEERIRERTAELAVFHKAIQQSGSAVVILNAKTRKIEFVNQAVCQLSGYSKEEYIGKSSGEFRKDTHSDEFYEAIWKTTLEEGKTWKGEVKRKGKSNNVYWEYATVSPVKTASGEITHLVLINEDITALKNFEASLKASEEKNRLLFDTMEQGIIVFGKEGNIVDANPSAQKILGVPLEKMKDHTIDSPVWITTYEDGSHFPSEIHPANIALTTGESVKDTVMGVYNNQIADNKWLLINAIPMYTKNNQTPDGTFVTFSDISDMKKMESHLRQAKEDAESANRAKSGFLANMSHELRTPLNSVIGFTQILLRQVGNIISDKQRGYLEYIKSSGDHLLEMVNDILDLSKIESGKTDLDIKPFDFRKMLENAPTIIKELAYQKRLDLTVNIQSNLGWIKGDETKLKQVIYNLLSNAVKYSEPKGKIGLDATTNGNNFIVIVWDKGVGIPEEYLEKIFDPFEQVTGANKPTEEGTGLGLAITKRLIELHHGTISVSSKLGEGSQFTVSLPGRISIEDTSSTTVSFESTAPVSSTRKDIKILIAEDSPSNRNLINAVIGDLYHLDFVTSGEEAVLKATENIYDAVLMDIQLPEIDGIKAMKEIKKKRTISPPIIAHTAFAMKGDKEKYLNEGFDDYISKPINVSLLLQKLKQVLG